MCLALGVQGCAWVTKSELAERADRDDDGHEAAQFGGDDCDDADGGVNPDAPEQCNTVDDDCNGVIDDVIAGDGTTFYADADGDGVGDPAVVIAACTLPEGAVDNALDCDDTDDAVNPSATELCNEVDDDCDGMLDDADDSFTSQTWWPDADADGYGVEGDTIETSDCQAPAGYAPVNGDCDDGLAAANPGAAEICDGIDDDCDGLTDDADDSLGDAPEWYYDADDDGYGDEAVTLSACDVPSGFVDNALDCDDENAAINPAADEHCDDLDENCDGEADDSAVDVTEWYADGDGDGYGRDDGRVTACDAPTGTVAVAGDCDDEDAEVHPYAEETCTSEDTNCDGVAGDLDSDGDGVAGCEGDCDDGDAAISPDGDEVCNGLDDDCDGAIDDDDASLDTTGLTLYYPDDDGDGRGDADATGDAACEQPAGTVADDGDCDDGDAEVNPESYELCSTTPDDDCDGDSDDCSLELASLTLALEGATGDRAGASLLAGLDLDGDGAGDLVVGAPEMSSTRGGIYVVSELDPPVSTELSDAVSWKGTSAGDGAGTALAGSDLDGDGYDDVGVGAPGGDVAYLLAGPASAGGGLTGAESLVTGLVAEAGFGTALVFGDLNGDGDADLTVGAPTEVVELGLGLETAGVGAVYAFFGPFSGDLDTDDADLRFQTAGQEVNSNIGRALAMLDADGDGDQELLIAALDRDVLGNNPVPEIYLFDPSSGGEYDDGDVTRTFTGASNRDSGAALAGGADVDGDGTDDLLVGDADAGKAMLLLGPLTSAPTALASADATFTGSDDFGLAVALLPDIDGDGAGELAVGGDNAACLWFGGALTGAISSANAHFTLNGDGSVDEAGAAIGAGDIDGDALPELFIGAPGAHSEAGAVYGVPGAPF